VEAEVDAAVAPVGSAPVDAAAGVTAAVTGVVVDTVAAAGAAAAAAPRPRRRRRHPPSLGHWRGTAGGCRGFLPTPLRADAVALAVGELGRIGREDGLLSLEVWGVMGRP